MQNQTGEPVVGLNKEEKVFLLKLVRSTITQYLKNGKLPETKPDSKKLYEKFGVFVTLHKKGKLRGCIGYVEGVDSLFKAVKTMAYSAAFRDPRFPPVVEKELDDIDIEISVLSPLKKIKNVNEIVVGKHGLIVQQGLSRGLLLPQVATEWGWDRTKFLEQTCLKAGLPQDAWQHEHTDIYIFTAEIFSEKEFQTELRQS
jgi:AmmeMemoRadiSam system protein A